MSQPPEDPHGQPGQYGYGEGQHSNEAGPERSNQQSVGYSQQHGYQLGGDPYAQQGYATPAVLAGLRQVDASLQLDDDSGRTYSLKQGGNVVGRGLEADFRVQDTGISRRHLEITWDGQSATLADLGSTNGTTVNGTPVQTRRLANGDVIGIGHSSLVFRDDQQTRKVPIDQRGSIGEAPWVLWASQQEDWPLGSTITIYTSSDDGEPLQDAIVELLEACGFEVLKYGPPVIGSWFRKLLIRSRDSKAADKLAELAGRLERAAELKYINTPRSENDEREANAIARLAQAMESMDEVVVRTSSVLFLKTDGRVLAWVLSEAEISILDHRPELMRSPTDILNILPRLRREFSTDTVPVKLWSATALDENP